MTSNKSAILLRINSARNVFKRKARPVQAWRPGQALRVPKGGKFVSLTHRPPLLLNTYPWYSHLLEAESTPGPEGGRKDYVNEKSQFPHWELNPRPSDLKRSASTNRDTACLHQKYIRVG